jgi:signal transduction histidine kinase
MQLTKKLEAEILKIYNTYWDNYLKGDVEVIQPLASVNTNKLGDKIEIQLAGNGIPQKILDKIFQPFFTTKPTGQGTDLELSLSYDNVKAHGGELKGIRKKEKEHHLSFQYLTELFWFKACYAK